EPAPAPCTQPVEVNAQVRTEARFAINPGPPSFTINHGALCGLWQGPARVWLWTTPQTAPTLPGNVFVIGRSGGKEILSNQPNTGGASF
ncbi:MAG TPA: hypothetical protein VL990_18950, partial [Acidobacteriaceae bacterium]|nr:hypothetical protein [Acidobacteriaceae bacterium]